MSCNMALSPPKKRVAKHFSVEDKAGIVNIFKARQEANPECSKTANVQFTATAAGVGVSSVYNILKEYTTNHVLQPPVAYHRSRSVLDNISEEDKYAIRRIVHSFFLKNEPPTIDSVLRVVNEQEELPTLKRTTFSRLLKEIGFRYSKRQRNSMLREKNEIISWRRRYLREIRKLRGEGRKIYYLDETWVNAGHTVGKVWMDTTVETARQAFNNGLSTGLKHPSGKGKRLIVLHIGSEDGFVEEGLLLFESKKTGDYHDEMNSEVFENWFSNILPRLEEGAVIVVDNASYHSRKLEKVPNTATRKGDIQLWLKDKGIAFEEDMVRAELLALVKENTPQRQNYVVDEMARSSGRTVLRLPPYHCEFNPIELIWGQIKGEVARKNTTFKIGDVKNLFLQAVDNVSADNWANAIRHAIGEEEKMWHLDRVMEIQVEPLIINLGEDSTSDSDSDEENV